MGLFYLPENEVACPSRGYIVPTQMPTTTNKKILKRETGESHRLHVGDREDLQPFGHVHVVVEHGTVIEGATLISNYNNSHVIAASESGLAMLRPPDFGLLSVACHVVPRSSAAQGRALCGGGVPAAAAAQELAREDGGQAGGLRQGAENRGGAAVVPQQAKVLRMAILNHGPGQGPVRHSRVCSSSHEDARCAGASRKVVLGTSSYSSRAHNH